MKKITKLAIFDFDGTLVDTPLPETGKTIYHEKKGTPWPHEGWWGRHESLDLEIFDMPVVMGTLTAYEKEMADENTAVILLTGRMVKLTSHVMAILKSKELPFDEYCLNRGGETGDAKMKSMDKLLLSYTDVTEVELWDDRLLHIPRFQAWGDKQIESGRLIKFKINVVPTTHHGE